MTECIWQLQDVRLASDGVTRLEESVLSIPSGVTAVIGYSGAGKTSLLNLLAKLEHPTSGTVARTFPDNTAAGIQMYWVPQDGGLWPHWSVAKHLTAVRPQNVTGPDGDNPANFADKLLTQFDLVHRQQAFPGELSMGERSRLSVARSLAARPAVLVMDEPLAHVDPVRRSGYWNVIREHLKQNQTSLVFSTHEPETAISESQWAICLSNGCVLYDGPTMELYNDPPSDETGRFLGPLNWFTQQEATTWLNSRSSSHVTLRAEAIRLVADDSVKTKVVSFRFCGSYAETIVTNPLINKQRTIVHRPHVNAHEPGQTVRIEVVS